jgi:S1-C subfamily serine protease
MEQKNILSSIVRIHAYGQSRSFSRPYLTTDRTKSVGTGVFVDPPDDVVGAEDYLFALTCAHVVDTADSLTVILPMVGETELPAFTLRFIPRTSYDLAVIAIHDPENIYRPQTRRLEIGTADTLAPGQKLKAYGFPLGQTALKVSDGVYSGFQHLLQHTVSISPGNSGGPLVDARMRIVGINNSGVADPSASNIGYAVPIDFYTATKNRLFESPAGVPRPGCVLRLPGFGFYYHPSTTSLVEEMTHSTRNRNRNRNSNDLSGGADNVVGEGSGVYLYKVLPGCALADAGVRRGELIVSFEGMDVDNRGEVRVPWNEQKVGLGRVLQRATDPDKTYEFGTWQPSGGTYRTIRASPSDVQVNGLRTVFPPYDPVEYVAFMGVCFMDLCANHQHDTATYVNFLKMEPEELLLPHVIVTHVFSGMESSIAGSLKTGSVVDTINGAPVRTLRDVRATLVSPIRLSSGRRVLTVATTDGRTLTLPLDAVLAQEETGRHATRVYDPEEGIIALLSSQTNKDELGVTAE